MVPLIKAVEMSSLSVPAAAAAPISYGNSRTDASCNDTGRKISSNIDNEDVSRQGYNQIMYYYCKSSL
ncbi:unnamed protein product [Rhizophagus irregularis]|nr:unnamed protein product [Rhizophagus irregularis]